MSEICGDGDGMATTENLTGSGQESDSAYIGLSEWKADRVRGYTFRQRIRRAIWRVKRLHWGFRKLTWYGIWRELYSLGWRIRVLRNSRLYLHDIALVFGDDSDAKTHRHARIEELFRKMGTQWMLSKYPQASAIDMQLFVLGWDRHRQSLPMILEALEMAERESPNSSDQ